MRVTTSEASSFVYDYRYTIHLIARYDQGAHAALRQNSASRPRVRSKRRYVRNMDASHAIHFARVDFRKSRRPYPVLQSLLPFLIEVDMLSSSASLIFDLGHRAVSSSRSGLPALPMQFPTHRP